MSGIGPQRHAHGPRGQHRHQGQPPAGNPPQVGRAASEDQQRAEVVDVGEGRPGHDQVAERLEEVVGVVAVEQVAARSGPAARARASVSGVTMAPALSSMPSMPSVSAASTCTPGSPCSAIAQPSRNSVARPPRPPLPAHGHRGLAAGQDHAGLGERLAAARHRARQRRVHLADLARLALDLVAKDVRRDAGARAPRAAAASSALLRRGDHVHLRGRRSAGRPAWASRRRRSRARRAPPAAARCRSACRIASASAQVRGVGHRRAAGDDLGRVAGHVADQQRDDPRRRAQRRQPPALDRRQVLAHAVHLVDGRAAASAAPC